MPKVSVVIAVYNGERFLAKTLDSILSQTFQDFELIIIDDGSEDGSQDILTSYQNLDSRVTVLTNETNLGIPKSRNLGCNQAKGEYIAVSDADDISLPRRFEIQVEYLDHHPEIAVVGSFIQHIDGEGTLGKVQKLPVLPGYLGWKLIFDDAFFHSSIMLRREVAASIGFYSEDTPVALDYDLFARISLEYKLTNIPDVLIYYRSWSGNISATKKNLQSQVATEIARRMISHYLKEAISFEEMYLYRSKEGANPTKIRLHAKQLQRIYEAYNKSVSLSLAEKYAIRNNMAFRYYRLALMTLKYSKSDAVELILKGFSYSPLAVITLLPLLFKEK